MSGLGYTFKGGWLTRRRLLQGTAGLAGAAAMGLPAFEGRAADKPQTANSLRSLTNPYHASFAKGGELFAKSVDAPYEVLVTEGNSEKGIADVRALLARTGGNLALCIDPNDSPDARVIVEECAKAGATVVTIWNKPADLHPWDFNPNYVAHISFDGVQYGKIMAETIFPLVPKGNYAIIKGNQADANADFLRAGMEEVIGDAVKAGDIVIPEGCEQYTDNWDPANAQTNMENCLTATNNDIQAVLAENDGMAGGVIAALGAQGMAGTIPVSGQDGDQGALNRVALGTQTVSVWKDARVLGKAAGEAAMALAKDPNLANLAGTAPFEREGKDTLTSIILAPTPVTQENLQVVVDAGVIDQATLCQGVTAGSVAACP